MKTIIIGGVAAGTKAAAKMKRCNRLDEVKILTKSKEISYAGCGLPYYVGGSIENRETLTINTPEQYEALTGVEVITGCEVTAIDFDGKKVVAKNQDGRITEESYDKLVIATGADAWIPPIEGVNLPGVFCVRTPEDAEDLRAYIKEKNCRKAVVCGAGFIGLEIAENLMAQDVSVTVIEAASQIMPNAFDREMADYAKKKLKEAGMKVMTETKLTGISGDGAASKVSTSTFDIAADVVVLSLGVRPSTAFLEGSKLQMIKGAIVVDEMMQTNIPDVYAAGDCAVVKNALTGEYFYSAMGSTANLTARILAKTLTGTAATYSGRLGTGVVKLLSDFNGGRTGLTEAQAKEEGYDAVSVLSVLDDKAHYYPGSASFITKMVADRKSHKLLGIQVFGAGAVDKMVDIAVVGLYQHMALEDFDTLDFAYAPPFSTAIHPFVTTCYLLENKMLGEFETFTPAQYAAGEAKEYQVIDVQPQPTIPGAKWVDLGKVNGPIDGLGREDKLLLVCRKGRRGYFLQNKLKSYGYQNTRVLEGGAFLNQVKVERTGKKLSDLEIKRVKGLGCLWDKRFEDVFNVRIITRNGKVTKEEMAKVAEAAEKFGSGEITMTSRLTLEIQGVPYDQIDALIEFVGEAGLETGGTGSKVRPIVSCKGTTCQYGLIDTFALSDKLHELYYKGYNGVALPHKFKIAVGGCPNNCVKPDLNDLGIIGQRVPETISDKCRGCKVCQVESACPLGITKVVDGKITIDEEACNHCGRCIEKCPFGAMESPLQGYKIYLGGRWGKKIAQGIPLNKIFTSEEEVIDMVERAILLFRDEGISGERFSDTIARLSFEYVENKLLSTKMDKEKIMSKTVVGGATC